jgi:dUTP pyrophosphatase
VIVAKPKKMEATVELQVKRLSNNAVIPTRGSEKAAGLDLYATNTATIPPLGKALIATDLSIGIPPGHYARVGPRSGLAWKNQIHVGAGIIDEDYTGHVQVVLFNLNPHECFIVNPGDRVAQLILEKISIPRLIEVSELGPSNRGNAGFGSTGKWKKNMFGLTKKCQEAEKAQKKAIGLLIEVQIAPPHKEVAVAVSLLAKAVWPALALALTIDLELILLRVKATIIQKGIRDVAVVATVEAIQLSVEATLRAIQLNIIADVGAI